MEIIFITLTKFVETSLMDITLLKFAQTEMVCTELFRYETFHTAGNSLISRCHEADAIKYSFERIICKAFKMHYLSYMCGYVYEV